MHLTKLIQGYESLLRKEINIASNESRTKSETTEGEKNIYGLGANR